MSAMRAAAALCLAGVTATASSASGQSPAFSAWAARSAVPLDSVYLDPAQLSAIGSIVGDAHIVEYGEPMHGGREPLAFRNSLVRYLVERKGITAVALETSLPLSRELHDFVLGAPGDAREVVARGFSYGFGRFQQNVELVEWLRAWNQDPAHRRKVSFYGMDVITDDASAIGQSLRTAIEFLERVDTMRARRFRNRLLPYLEAKGVRLQTSSDPDSLTASIDDLVTFLSIGEPDYVARTSREDYAWALRNAVAARQGDTMIRLAPPDLQPGALGPGVGPVASSRDMYMAENVDWILQRQGAGGRVFVFAHNGHIMNSPKTGGAQSIIEEPYRSMGEYLRATHANDLVIIGTAATYTNQIRDEPLPQDGIDAALSSVGRATYLLDLRSVQDPAAHDWLSHPRPLIANGTGENIVTPASAFDVFLFVRGLTRAHRN